MTTRSTISWEQVYHELNTKGYARIPRLLSADACHALLNLYPDPTRYRSIINMQRYRFGKGEYKYFSYPLPTIVQQLREELYGPLAKLANDWMHKLSLSEIFPQKHTELIARCHAKNQLRPTPLILRYEAGGYNTLHQDLYGEVYFPLQVVIVLNQHGRDYEGGEFVLTEQIPRAQSKANVIRPDEGDAVIITTNFRPVQGSRGYYRAAMRHGVAEVTSGIRQAMGIIFHDGL